MGQLHGGRVFDSLRRSRRRERSISNVNVSTVNNDNAGHYLTACRYSMGKIRFFVRIIELENF